jgi:integrase
LLTGLRRQEAAKLRWQDVDLKARTFVIVDTKNRDSHTLPLSDYLVDLLRRRKENSTSAYIFPGDGKMGYIVEPRLHIERVAEASEVPFTLHDLRRTFVTTAERLDIPAYALKRLLNHKMRQDVTAGYIIADAERLREPMQKITDFVLKAAGVKESAEVVDLNDKQKAVN